MHKYGHKNPNTRILIDTLFIILPNWTGKFPSKVEGLFFFNYIYTMKSHSIIKGAVLRHHRRAFHKHNAESKKLNTKEYIFISSGL